MQAQPEISQIEDSQTAELTDRQRRELEYHRGYAESKKQILSEKFDFDVVESSKRRWWNQYWAMFTYLLGKDLKDKKVLVIGCGFGEDAINLAKAGANVSAFDLSPESIDIASAVAEKEGLEIDFKVMPAEKLTYLDNQFDIVIARDILHHVEIDETISEVIRVSKPDGILFFNEVYSHSIFKKIRYSYIVDKIIYPRMVSFIYKTDDPYITEDEDRLTEIEVNQISERLGSIEKRTYFNVLVTRVLPEKFVLISMIDQLVLQLLKPIGSLLGSRVIMAGVISKNQEPALFKRRSGNS